MTDQPIHEITIRRMHRPTPGVFTPGDIIAQVLTTRPLDEAHTELRHALADREDNAMTDQNRPDPDGAGAKLYQVETERDNARYQLDLARAELAQWEANYGANALPNASRILAERAKLAVALREVLTAFPKQLPGGNVRSHMVASSHIARWREVLDSTEAAQ